ncbi:MULTISPECIES: hypothetical protein [unclassified Flammeovirga]|uniref:hypothetical protein n=1 Tax=unclassified Flammeovirga TaxID=2637820 RepID=UPI0005C4C095|nr:MULTISPECIES: hypothetical protein [unclassified Flammeovirga]MBD0403756.1 hypothetical protein [Flammeovirga sp. EKP202]
MKHRVSLLLLLPLIVSLFSFSPVKSDFPLSSKNDTTKQDKERRKDKLSDESEWLFYAESAKQRILKNENLQDALELIDQSLDLQINPINLEIKGDYYTKMGDLNSAFEQYQKAIQLCVFDIKKRHQLKSLQTKAISIRRLLSSKKQIDQ